MGGCVTSEKRLELAARCAQLVRVQIERNGGVYDGGSMAPNLQSIVDLAHVDSDCLDGAEKQVAELERRYKLTEGDW